MVVGVGSGHEYLDLLLAFEISLHHVAFRLEPPQRVELQPSRVGKPAVGRTAPVAAFAQRHRTFGREVEALAPAHVVFAEEPEIAVEVELAVDDAAVDKLQGARRVNARPVGLDLGLPEPDVPLGAGDVVDDCVAHNVHIAVGQRFRVVGGESQLNRIDQFRGIDVPVEAQAQALDLRIGFREREILVERESHHVLHPEAHCQREPVAFGAERDALADFEVGHVAYALQQFVFVFERIGGDEFGLPQWRAFLCCSDCAAARQHEQKECLFHVGLVCLFVSFCFVSAGFGQKYKKYALTRLSRCKVGR